MTSSYTPTLIYLLGPTNAGKSTFIEYAGTQDCVGTIEVGKYMRAKYPPSHFAGEGNPAHTAVEAWKVYEDMLAKHIADNKRLIIADGQPRDAKQTEAILGDGRSWSHRVFVHLWAPLDVLTARAHARDGHDPEKLALTKGRLINDMSAVYTVLSMVLSGGHVCLHEDTSKPEYSAPELLDRILHQYTYGKYGD